MKDHYNKYRQIAKKRGMSVEVVKTICDSQFEFVKRTISAEGDIPVRLQYLGTFYVKDNRREWLHTRRIKIKEALNERRKQKEQRTNLQG
jgi:nucleoid DNA-binding protein